MAPRVGGRIGTWCVCVCVSPTADLSLLQEDLQEEIDGCEWGRGGAAGRLSGEEVASAGERPGCIVGGGGEEEEEAVAMLRASRCP